MGAAPTIRYALTVDGVDIAYWTLGKGPALVVTPNVQYSHLSAEWEVEGCRRFFETMARTRKVARYDHRGGGLSSRARSDFSMDALVRDIDAVARSCWPSRAPRPPVAA